MKNYFKLFLMLFAVISFAFMPLKSKKTVVIDAGHGGTDHGAQANTTNEKEIVEKIAHNIKSLNSNHEVEIILLREKDKSMTLNERLALVNQIKPDLLISLHVNLSENQNKNGVEAFVSQENSHFDTSKKIAMQLIDSFTKTPLKKGDVKTGKMLILKNANCPAVILEIGYLSNKNDLDYLSKTSAHNEIAKTIFDELKK